MSETVSLEHHLCIKSTNQVSKITRPLTQAFEVQHFRYLKLYQNGSRVLLTNHPDSVRFMYGQGHYKQMWFDGEFPQHLANGWHIWDALRTETSNNLITPLEKEINHHLNLYHGLTFVIAGSHFHEIYTFDSHLATINQVNRQLFLRFIYYFKEQAAALINQANNERLIMPGKPKLELQANTANLRSDEINDFLNNTQITRYYLGDKYDNAYLTRKEVCCIYWLLKGKSAEEIACIEGNTKKTVQCHLETIRNKLNCHKQTQIIPIILESGILDTFFNVETPAAKD
ncbi:MAG: helix-turn-helix domain-containing protein [Tatlockia sp.]|nr:helix-turn-helix domain-containing protein [Tatlockia sp.]